MKFRAQVEPNEPMRGWRFPARRGARRRQAAEGDHHNQWALLEESGCDHAWPLPARPKQRQSRSRRRRDRRGRVEIELAFDPEPPTVNVPEDFARALDADPAARAAYDRLTHSRKREHVRAIETAKKPETRKRRIEKALATLKP